MQHRPWTVLTLAALMLIGSGSAFAQDRYLHPFERQQLSDKFFGEGANFADLNNDGHMDVVSGPYWYEGPAFEKQHAYYKPKPFKVKGYSDNFFAFTHDFNDDGWTDVLIIGFPGKTARWYENPGGESTDPASKNRWKKHVVFKGVDNESPTFTDINGDGKPELVCQHDKQFGYATVDWDNPAEKWTYHAISKKGAAGGRFAHGLGVGDVNGDGRMDLLEKNGWWEQPDTLASGVHWKHHQFRFAGPGGAQMYAYDVDGDGDNDVITALDAHGYGLAWYEHVSNNGEIAFKRHKIIGKDPEANKFGVAFSQPHAIDLVDMNGDGLKDLVTGKRWYAHNGKDPGGQDPAVVYWFRLERKKNGEAEFVPRPIDNDSGVGTQVVAGDVTGDGLKDVIVGNKKGTYVLKHNRRKVSQFEYFWAHQPGMFTLGYTPQQAADRMELPDGFNASLVAGEPKVRQPIALALDDEGRLWVAEHYEYPDWSPEGEDRILIFEDTNGDGTLDNRKVFAEGLNFVSGLEVGFGGVWVGSPPNLLFIPDRDGDDVPDSEPQVKLTGWGHQDTHETLNGFIWGPDGWLYGCQGVFTHSKVGKPGTPESEREPINAGFWRYHPQKEEFEVFSWGTSNPWGIDFNDYGQAFSPVCVIPHLHHIIQGARHRRQSGQHFNPYVYESITNIGDHLHHGGGNIRAVKQSTDEAGGGHAHCGAMIYLGDNWPEEYRNDLFMGNIRGSRVNNDTFERKGSGYVGRHKPDFLMANDDWFRPINLRYGPDGGVYLIDWYDQRACHQQKPDDRSNGRIYKVTHGEVKPHNPELAERSDKELVELQLHENDWYVRTARRILQHRAAKGELDDGTRAALRKILRENPKVPRKLRALWALHVTGGLGDELAMEQLNSDHEFVRAWTVQLILEDRAVSDQLHEKLASMARYDKSLVVGKYLASALQRLPHERRWAIAGGLVGREAYVGDKNIPLLTWYGVEPLVPENPERAIELAESSKLRKVRRYIVRRAAEKPELIEPVIGMLNRADAPRLRRLIVNEMATALGDQVDVPMPDGWSEAYQKLIEAGNAAVRDKARSIAVKFGDRRVFPMLRKRLANTDAKIERRRRALQILLNGKDPKMVPVLHDLLGEPKLRGDALKALAAFDHPDTPAAILAHYDAFNDQQKSDAISTLAARPSYALALLDAIDRGKIPRGDLSAFTVRQMVDLGNQKVTSKLNEVWGTIGSTSKAKKKRIRELQTMLAAANLDKADRSHGRALFNKTCAACHTLFGEGGKIAPDLTGSNRNNLQYLLQNIVTPNAVVGRDYQLTVIQTEDGRVVSGMVKSESDSALTVQTLNDQVVVAKDQVKSKTRAPTSMMPAGLLQPLSDEDVKDLFAYLMSPKQVPLPGEEPIEGESLEVLNKSAGNVRPQGMGGFDADEWSGGRHLWWTGAEPGDRLTLGVPVEEPGTYTLEAVFTKARDYGTVRLRLDGDKARDRLDLFNPPKEGRNDVVATAPVELGTHDLDAGTHELTVEILGANDKAEKRYMFALDYLLLQPAEQ